MVSAEESYKHFISGDKNAFSNIINEYRDSLIFYINGIVHNEDTSEEIAADCFAELIVHPSRFGFKSSLKTYLFSVAHYKAVNYIKKNSKLVLFSSGEQIEKSVEYTEFENDILQSEENRALHAALPRIKEEYAEALHLIYFEEMSYKEAALIMHKSVKQIDNYVARGKSALKKILEEEGISHA